jgi:hypothetical protein
MKKVVVGKRLNHKHDFRTPERKWLDQHGSRNKTDICFDNNNRKFVWMKDGRDGNFNPVYLPINTYTKIEIASVKKKTAQDPVETIF